MHYMYRSIELANDCTPIHSETTEYFLLLLIAACSSERSTSSSVLQCRSALPSVLKALSTGLRHPALWVSASFSQIFSFAKTSKKRKNLANQNSLSSLSHYQPEWNFFEPFFRINLKSSEYLVYSSWIRFILLNEVFFFSSARQMFYQSARFVSVIHNFQHSFTVTSFELLIYYYSIQEKEPS